MRLLKKRQPEPLSGLTVPTCFAPAESAILSFKDYRRLESKGWRPSCLDCRQFTSCPFVGDWSTKEMTTL